MTSDAVPLTPPAVDGPWLRPVPGGAGEPRWGHVDGLQLGLAPLPGPRGLLRVYAPYLGHPHGRMITFIAVEPIPAGSDRRGYSELERSSLDDAPGKRFRLEDPEGTVREIDGVAHLEHRVHTERFDNGAEVDVVTRFRADRPHEVVLAATAREGSVPLRACILSATMGNYARLRTLELRDRTVSPAELWPGFTGTDFTDHAAFGVAELPVRDGEVVVAATTDEAEPDRAAYAPGTSIGWHWTGRRARQAWRAADPHPELRAQANARAAYWASSSPIPGGAAFENIEVVEPYRPGRELAYAVDPLD